MEKDKNLVFLNTTFKWLKQLRKWHIQITFDPLIKNSSEEKKQATCFRALDMFFPYEQENEQEKKEYAEHLYMIIDNYEEMEKQKNSFLSRLFKRN